tara:strand:- start:266 stop:484 length:219 start_codon:yes stop_codon:yes gene_type:complete
MIVPVRCFTCGNLIGNKWDTYTTEIEKINNNTTLSEEDKIDKTIELFNKLKLKRYCCRMILTSTVDMTNIII